VVEVISSDSEPEKLARIEKKKVDRPTEAPKASKAKQDATQADFKEGK
jgi:hypothetical protein